jgi:hypothetical protein
VNPEELSPAPGPSELEKDKVLILSILGEFGEMGLGKLQHERAIHFNPLGIALANLCSEGKVISKGMEDKHGWVYSLAEKSESQEIQAHKPSILEKEKEEVLEALRKTPGLTLMGLTSSLGFRPGAAISQLTFDKKIVHTPRKDGSYAYSLTPPKPDTDFEAPQVPDPQPESLEPMKNRLLKALAGSKGMLFSEIENALGCLRPLWGDDLTTLVSQGKVIREWSERGSWIHYLPSCTQEDKTPVPMIKTQTDTILEILKENGVMTKKQVAEKGGFLSTSTGSNLARLVKEGKVVHDSCFYALPNIQGDLKAKIELEAKTNPTQEELLLKFMGENPREMGLRELYDGVKFNPGPVLSKLVRSEKVLRPREGIYIIAPPPERVEPVSEPSLVPTPELTQKETVLAALAKLGGQGTRHEIMLLVGNNPSSSLKDLVKKGAIQRTEPGKYKVVGPLLNVPFKTLPLPPIETSIMELFQKYPDRKFTSKEVKSLLGNASNAICNGLFCLCNLGKIRRPDLGTYQFNPDGVPQPRGKAKGPRGKAELLSYLATVPQASVQEITKKIGIPFIHGIKDTLVNLVRKNEIHRVSPGVYSIGPAIPSTAIPATPVVSEKPKSVEVVESAPEKTNEVKTKTQMVFDVILKAGEISRVEIMKKVGFNPSNCLFDLTEKQNKLRRVAPGIYKVSPGVKPPSVRPSHPEKSLIPPLEAEVLGVFEESPDQVFTAKDIEILLGKSNLSPLLSVFLSLGKIHRVSPGVYRKNLMGTSIPVMTMYGPKPPALPPSSDLTPQVRPPILRKNGGLAAAVPELKITSDMLQRNPMWKKIQAIVQTLAARGGSPVYTKDVARDAGLSDLNANYYLRILASNDYIDVIGEGQWAPV